MYGQSVFLLTSVSHSAAVKIKKPIQTKFRLPVLNWVALKPSQINGTVFNDIDDESILQVTKTLKVLFKHVAESEKNKQIRHICIFQTQQRLKSHKLSLVVQSSVKSVVFSFPYWPGFVYLM